MAGMVQDALADVSFRLESLKVRPQPPAAARSRPQPGWLLRHAW
jgi:hypothetical protein